MTDARPRSRCRVTAPAGTQILRRWEIMTPGGRLAVRPGPVDDSEIHGAGTDSRHLLEEIVLVIHRLSGVKS